MIKQPLLNCIKIVYQMHSMYSNAVSYNVYNVNKQNPAVYYTDKNVNNFK